MLMRPKHAAIAIIVIFAGLLALEMLLALGFPIGRFAWGGYYTIVPIELRIASVVAMAFYAIAMVIVLATAKMIAVSAESRFVRYGIWALTLLFSLATVMNLASQSPYERLLMTPIALILSILCFTLARRYPAAPGRCMGQQQLGKSR